MKLGKFGKIKNNGVWCDFHESDVITGNISDDYCKFKIEEFKPKMNKYKIIESNGGLDYQKLISSAPDYQKLMDSGIEIESYSKHEAMCSIYANLPNTWRQCYMLDIDSLKLFLVYWYRDSMGRMTTTESFQWTLEKSQMKIYKIIPNQNKHPDSITYEFMMNYFTVESDSPVNAFRKYCEHDSFVLNLDSNFGYVFDTESLDLYYTSWSIDEQIGHSSFVKKLEKPIEKPKMKTYRLIPNQKNLNPSYEEMMASEYLIEAHSPKNALERHRNLNPKVNCGMALDIGTLDLYRVLYSTSFLDGDSYSDCFVRKLRPEPKMNKYKILLDDDSDPSFEKMMSSRYLIEAASPKNAFIGHRTINPKWGRALILDTETLDLYRVSFSTIRREYTADFVKKLEKPELKMKTYKIIPWRDSPTYENLTNLKISKEIKAESVREAFIKFCESENKDFLDSQKQGFVLHAETLNLYDVQYHCNSVGQVVVKIQDKGKLEKPIEKPMNTLSFKTLTEANNKRLPLFKNSKGLPAHSKPDGSDWSHSEWLQAVIGELGEYANIMKKVQRGDLTMEEAKPSIEKELADVMTYFSILAQQLNIDLGQAVEDKFNEVSERVKANIFIKDDVVYSTNTEIGKDSLVSKKEKLHNELEKFKEKTKHEHLTAKYYHKPVAINSNELKVDSVKQDNNSDFATKLMVGVGLAQILTQFIKKPVQKFITLQDLNNGKVYTQPFKSGFDSSILQEFSKLIVKDATVTKTLQNGKDYDGFNVNVGDMIQFSDDRNVLYSLRVTKIE